MVRVTCLPTGRTCWRFSRQQPSEVSSSSTSLSVLAAQSRTSMRLARLVIQTYGAGWGGISCLPKKEGLVGGPGCSYQVRYPCDHQHHTVCYWLKNNGSKGFDKIGIKIGLKVLYNIVYDQSPEVRPLHVSYKNSVVCKTLALAIVLYFGGVKT